MLCQALGVGPGMPFDLSCLIEAVEAEGSQDALPRIERAIALADEIGVLSERLVGYYVERARSDGRSWAEIGALVGVTRQAAQQRFGARLATLSLSDLERAGGLGRMTKRARDVLDEAEGQARRLRHPSLRAEHVLSALLEDGDSLATRAIEATGIKGMSLRSLVSDNLSPGTGAPPAVIPLDASTRRAMSLALTEALLLGHNYVGTEHLLLGMLRDQDGSAASLLREGGVDAAAVRNKVIELLDEYLRSRT